MVTILTPTIQQALEPLVEHLSVAENYTLQQLPPQQEVPIRLFKIWGLT